MENWYLPLEELVVTQNISVINWVRLNTNCLVKESLHSPAPFLKTLKRHQLCQNHRCCARPPLSCHFSEVQARTRLVPLSSRSLGSSPSTGGSVRAPATPDRTVCASATSAFRSAPSRCPGPPRPPPRARLHRVLNPSGRTETAGFRRVCVCV